MLTGYIEFVTVAESLRSKGLATKMLHGLKIWGVHCIIL
jgi:hypothetical protein